MEKIMELYYFEEIKTSIFTPAEKVIKEYYDFQKIVLRCLGRVDDNDEFIWCFQFHIRVNFYNTPYI
jgi:hypothetical protein